MTFRSNFSVENAHLVRRNVLEKVGNAFLFYRGDDVITI